VGSESFESLADIKHVTAKIGSTFLVSGFIRFLREENRPHPQNWIERKGAGVLGSTKADWGQTWPSLALKRAEEELAPDSGQLAPTWVQLEPNWGPTWRNVGTFGRKFGLTCSTWSCVGASAVDKPNVGNMALHDFPLKPKIVGNR